MPPPCSTATAAARNPPPTRATPFRRPTMSIAYQPGKAPHPREHRLIFRNIDRAGWQPTLAAYLADGGYQALAKALAMEPKAVTEEVKKSGLRGRGGAGFPTGMKWTFIPPQHQAGLPDLQRRRIRARHLQGPLHPPPGPAPVARGHGDRRLRGRRPPRLHLHPRGIPRGREDPRGAIAEARAAGFSAPTSSAAASTSRFSSTAAPAPTSAARKPA
jgi:hypothetical protein